MYEDKKATIELAIADDYFTTLFAIVHAGVRVREPKLSDEEIGNAVGDLAVALFSRLSAAGVSEFKQSRFVQLCQKQDQSRR